MTKKINAMFPGSFNPIHAGHLDVIQRASKIFAKLYVVVSINMYKDPKTTLEKRLVQVKKEVDKLHLKNVEVLLNRGLTVDFAKKHNVTIIVRSVRNYADLIYEMDMAKANNCLNNKIETILMLPREELKNLSSTALRYLKDVKKKK